jgi:general stress protein 26
MENLPISDQNGSSITTELQESSSLPVGNSVNDVNIRNKDLSLQNDIYFTTRVTTKKVSNLRRKNIVGYCIDDPDPPFKGVRGKGIIKIHEDVTSNITIAKTITPIEEVRVIRKVDPVTR